MKPGCQACQWGGTTLGLLGLRRLRRVIARFAGDMQNKDRSGYLNLRNLVKVVRYSAKTSSTPPDLQPRSTSDKFLDMSLSSVTGRSDTTIPCSRRKFSAASWPSAPAWRVPPSPVSCHIQLSKMGCAQECVAKGRQWSRVWRLTSRRCPIGGRLRCARSGAMLGRWRRSSRYPKRRLWSWQCSRRRCTRAATSPEHAGAGGIRRWWASRRFERRPQCRRSLRSREDRLPLCAPADTWPRASGRLRDWWHAVWLRLKWGRWCAWGPEHPRTYDLAALLAAPGDGSVHSSPCCCQAKDAFQDCFEVRFTSFLHLQGTKPPTGWR